MVEQLLPLAQQKVAVYLYRRHSVRQLRAAACGKAGGHLGRWAGTAGLVAVAAILLNPFYFVIFRLMIFSTVPRDDYAPFLLWLLHMPGGGFPISPYGYRILSMVAAAPFYFILPTIHLTNIPEAIPEPYLKATAAIAALSFVSLIAASIMAYRLAVDRCGLSRIEGLFAGALMFILCWHSAVFGIDPFGILLVCVGLYVLHRGIIFAIFLLGSVVCNEKVAIFFAIWLTIRWLLCRSDRVKMLTPWLTSLTAIAGYAAMLAIVRLPGDNYQLEPTSYPMTSWENLLVYPTARGLLLNALPIVVLLGIAISSWLFLPKFPRDWPFRPVDIAVIFGMALVALVVTQFFQAGRIVMYAAPLFVVPAGSALARRVGRSRP